jgi:hypothetical protein
MTHSSDSAPFADDALVRRIADVVEAPVEEDLVGLDPSSGTCFGLNAVAHRIWRLLAEPNSINGICDVLTAEYAVGRDECRAQVAAFLDELRRGGLVAVADART